MILHLHLIRHGQTYFNRYNRLQGWTNAPLTEAGLANAHKAGNKLRDLTFAAAYCSDTTRAEQTARIILDDNEHAGHTRPTLTTDMHFREQFYGYFEGLDMDMAWRAAGAPHHAPTYNAIVDQYGLGATRDFLKQADPFHDAESDDEYWQRVQGGYELIASNTALADGDNVLVVAHGNTLLSLMHRFAPTGYDLTERPQNGSVTVLDFDTTMPFAESLTVISYNE